MLSAAVLPGAMGNAQQVSLEQPVSLSSLEAGASGESDNAWHRTEFVVFSATVYDRRVTELRWNEGGRAFRAVSNIDFSLFSGIGEIDLGMTRVLYLMAIGNAATIDPRTRTVLAPPPEVATALQALPANFSAYAILGDAPPESDRTLQILDKIHPYFDANRARVIQAFEAREAERLARLEYEKAIPPPPFDAPLSFWLQKSQEHILKQRSAPAEETK